MLPGKRLRDTKKQLECGKQDLNRRRGQGVCVCVCVWAEPQSQECSYHHGTTLKHLRNVPSNTFFPPPFPAIFLLLLPLPPSLPRLAAEEQIQGLQGLIDETFKQFALDDSEDDFEEDSEGSVYNGEWGGGTPEAKKRALYTNPTIV